MAENSHVVYQNKDVVSKYLAECFADKSFAVYGVKAPKIKAVLPTNLPVVEANELRIDNLFLLKDGSLALVDYESEYADENKIKYLNYIIRTIKRNMKQMDMFRKIRMIVIYTADIMPGQTRSRLDVGCLQFQLEEAFLNTIDSEKVEERIRMKLKKRRKLTSKEQMEFIILPLTYQGKEAKQACIQRCFALAKEVRNEREQFFLLSGLLAFTDKVIDTEDAKRMEEWMKMTKVAQLFEEEKIAYGEEKARETAEVTAKVTAREIAGNMLCQGESVERVVSIVTILSKEEVEELAGEVLRKQET